VKPFAEYRHADLLPEAEVLGSLPFPLNFSSILRRGPQGHIRIYGKLSWVAEFGTRRLGQSNANRLLAFKLSGALNFGRLRGRRPVSSPVTGHLHRQFQPAPNANFVEGAAEVVFSHRFGGADDLSDFAVGQTLPQQNGDLNFFWSTALAGYPDCIPCLSRMAMASFCRFAAIPDSSAQEQCAQVLLNGARADVELARNFVVARSLDQQIQHLLVGG
jgi:hypothetical protein